MITELFVNLAASIMEWVILAIPIIAVPAWLGPSGPVASVVSSAAGLGYWIPFELAGTIGVAVLGCIGVGVGLKLGRALLSLVTGGGGASS